MKWSPSPWKIRNPGPPVIGVYPMTIGNIRSEILIYIRRPYISKVWFVNPGSVRAQFVIKNL
jgi:hypothetical protein